MTTSADRQITTTLGVLVSAESALRRVVEQQGMTAKTKYHLAKLARLVAQELKHFYEERQGVFREFGTPRESANPAERAKFGPTVLELKPGQLLPAQKRLDEIAAVEVTIDWGPVRSCDLPSATVADYLNLGPLCELVEPPDA